MPQIKRIKCGNGNCYIVRDEDSSILIDTARPKYRDLILATCKKENVKLIVLTHAHMDHCQNALFLSQELNIPIAISKDDEELISNNMKQLLSAKTILGKIVLFISLKSFQFDEIPLFKTSFFLSEGDSLDEYGVRAKIIVLPGHTNGSIGVDVENDGIIVGDALMNMFYPTLSMLYHNYEKMIESANKISEFSNRKIYFGHGKPCQNRTWVKKAN